VHYNKSDGFDFRLGSKADIGLVPVDVRYSPQKRTIGSATVMSAKCQKRISTNYYQER
jgi:hypothetical protein